MFRKMFGLIDSDLIDLDSCGPGLLERDFFEQSSEEDEIRNQKKLIYYWWKRTCISQKSHYLTSIKYERNRTRIVLHLAMVNAVLISLVTSVNVAEFATQSIDIFILLSIKILAISSTVLASLQGFLKLGEKEEKHRKTAADFSILQRQIEVFATEFINNIDNEQQTNDGQQTVRSPQYFKEFTNDITQKYNLLIADTPKPEQKFFKKAQEGFIENKTNKPKSELESDSTDENS